MCTRRRAWASGAATALLLLAGPRKLQLQLTRKSSSTPSSTVSRAPAASGDRSKIRSPNLPSWNRTVEVSDATPRAERSNPSGDRRAQQWTAGACVALVAPLAEVNTKFKPARGNYLKDKTFIAAAKKQKRERDRQARNNARQQAVSKPRSRKQLRQAADKPAGVAAGEAVPKRKAPAAVSRARPAKLSWGCCNGPAADPEVTAEGFEPPASRLRIRRPPLRLIWC